MMHFMTSVTRLDYLSKVIVSNSSYKNSPNIEQRFELFWKSFLLKKKLLWLLFGQIWGNLGYFLFYYLVTLFMTTLNRDRSIQCDAWLYLYGPISGSMQQLKILQFTTPKMSFENYTSWIISLFYHLHFTLLDTNGAPIPAPI